MTKKSKKKSPTEAQMVATVEVGEWAFAKKPRPEVPITITMKGSEDLVKNVVRVSEKLREMVLDIMSCADCLKRAEMVPGRGVSVGYDRESGTWTFVFLVNE